MLDNILKLIIIYDMSSSIQPRNESLRFLLELVHRHPDGGRVPETAVRTPGGLSLPDGPGCPTL